MAINLTGCGDSISNKVRDAQLALGANKDALLKDAREAIDAAEAAAWYDFPLAQELMDNVKSFFTSTTTGMANGIANQLVDEALGAGANSVLAIVGTITTMAAAIASVGTEAQLMLYSLIIDSLKNELRIRILYYNLLQFHLRSLLTVLQSYDSKEYRPNLLRLKIALPYVQQAHKIFIRLREAGNEKGAPFRGQQQSLDIAFNKIEAAKRILSGDDSVGAQYASDVKKALKKKNLRTVSWRDFEKANNNLFLAFRQKVLARTIYTLENIAWNVSRMILLFPLPFAGLNYTSGSLIQATGLSGSAPPATFNPTAMDKLIADLKKAKGLGNSIKAIDMAKGLIATNILTTSLMEQIITFDTDFKSLQDSAKIILTALSPAESLLKKVKDDMESSLKANASEIDLTLKEPLWIVQLKSLDAFKRILGDAYKNTTGLGNAAESLLALKDTITEYLLFKDNDQKILESMVNIITTVTFAPTSSRALVESRVLCTQTLKIVSKAIGDNQRVLNAANAFVMPDSFYNKMFKELLAWMGTLPPPASTISQAFASGQIATIATVLAGLASSITDLAKALENGCKNDVPGAPIPQETKKNNDPLYARNVNYA